MTYKPEEYELVSEAVQRAWRHLRDTAQSADETMEKAALSHAVLNAAALRERSEPFLLPTPLLISALRKENSSNGLRTASAVGSLGLWCRASNSPKRHAGDAPAETRIFPETRC
jgi:hypothetical protein